MGFLRAASGRDDAHHLRTDSEGRKLANELGVELCGDLLGDNVKRTSPRSSAATAQTRSISTAPLLKDYTTDALYQGHVDVILEMKPEVLLIGATNIGRDLAPRCAARLHTGLCADCTTWTSICPTTRTSCAAPPRCRGAIEKMDTAKIMGQGAA